MTGKHNERVVGGKYVCIYIKYVCITVGSPMGNHPRRYDTSFLW